MAQCLMCGDSGRLTREHAMPAWIDQAVGATSNGVVLHMYAPRPETGVAQRVWSTNRIDIKVKNVCSACNNGWMSQLESEAKDVLAPLIQGEPRTLTPADCELTTRWFLKTMLMLQLAGDEKLRIALPTHEDWVRSGRLPADVALWLGTVRPGVTLAAGKAASIQIGDHAGDAWMYVIVIGHLVLMAFGTDEGLGVSELNDPLAAALTRLWPSPPPVVAWPPHTLLDWQQIAGLPEILMQSLPSYRS